MPAFTDQIGRIISQANIPNRIISLVPSQTELLFDLGLEEKVVGITKFCIHPEKWFQNKIKVGGTKEIKLDMIKQLNPDLVIANKEENKKEQIEKLEKYFPVWTSDINNLSDAFDMIEKIGQITGTEKRAAELNKLIRKNFNEINFIGPRKKAAYLIWRNPYMTVGGDTFINAMIESAGFENIFINKFRYPETSIEELNRLNVDLLLLSSEPYPFGQMHLQELQPQLPNTKIILVDGEMFSWYGSRLLKAPEYFNTLRQLL